MLNKDISSAARFSLLGILFLSGANGLMMEIVFRRQLLLSLGVTHYSVATVLTVFMSGLALGSFFLAGFAALSLEVHWTRILAYVVGSHGYECSSLSSLVLSSLVGPSYVLVFY